MRMHDKADSYTHINVPFRSRHAGMKGGFLLLHSWMLKILYIIYGIVLEHFRDTY